MLMLCLCSSSQLFLPVPHMCTCLHPTTELSDDVADLLGGSVEHSTGSVGDSDEAKTQRQLNAMTLLERSGWKDCPSLAVCQCGLPPVLTGHLCDCSLPVFSFCLPRQNAS